MFLKEYKIMLAKDSRIIYKSKDYYYKRLKLLEKEHFIKRVDRFYIKLDFKGLKLIKSMGYDYRNICRRIDYQERIKEISKIATLTLDSCIKFKSSLELKDNTIFTETSRKYIGELEYQNKKYLTYYISNNKCSKYIRQVLNDIQKTINYKNILLFMENTKCINKTNKYFIFGKESTVIVKANKENFEKMRLFENFDTYELINKIFKGKEILLSNWRKADYMIDNKEYILFMPFVDTEKLHRINIFYNNNIQKDIIINILTLKENKAIIDEILTKKTNIIEIDTLIGGINEKI